MRVFIALPVSDQMRKTLVDVMHGLKQQGAAGRYVPAQNFHITLAFLGEVKDLRPVKEIMEQIPVEKSRLSFDGLEIKQDQIRMKVKANQKLKKYVSDLKKALKEAGYSIDEEKLEPHITILRGLKGKRPELGKAEGDMMLARISLMKSEEKDGKRVYKELHSVLL